MASQASRHIVDACAAMKSTLLKGSTLLRQLNTLSTPI